MQPQPQERKLNCGYTFSTWLRYLHSMIDVHVHVVGQSLSNCFVIIIILFLTSHYVRYIYLHVQTSYNTAHMEEFMAELTRSKVDVEKYTEPGTGLTLLLVGLLGVLHNRMFFLERKLFLFLYSVLV